MSMYMVELNVGYIWLKGERELYIKSDDNPIWVKIKSLTKRYNFSPLNVDSDEEITIVRIKKVDDNVDETNMNNFNIYPHCINNTYVYFKSFYSICEIKDYGMRIYNYENNCSEIKTFNELWNERNKEIINAISNCIR